MEKRDHAESLAGVRKIIAIGSCKGGVGKTTVCVNLALALTKLGSRVGIFDADLYGPNVPIMLGVRRDKNMFPLQTSRGGMASMQFIPLARAGKKPYIKPLEKYGLTVMSLGFWFSDSFSMSDEGLLGSQMVMQTFVDVIWGEQDFLLLDLPPGTGSINSYFLKTIPLEGIVLVLTPQDLTLQDTNRAIYFYKKLDVHIIGIVENMSYTICPKCGEQFHIFQKHYDDWPLLKDLPHLGSVPLDMKLGSILDESHPLRQKDYTSPQAQKFIEIASKIKDGLAE